MAMLSIGNKMSARRIGRSRLDGDQAWGRDGLCLAPTQEGHDIISIAEIRRSSLARHVTRAQDLPTWPGSMRGLTWRRSYRVYRALPVESNIRCSALASARESHATPSQHTYIARLKNRRHHAKQHQQLPLREAIALYRWAGSWATAKIQSTEVACFCAPAVLPLKTVACPDVRAGFGSRICFTEQGSA
jgi:hypothetical protein